ncbi:MAG: MFS transporter [Haloferacaceae archaeon]
MGFGTRLATALGVDGHLSQNDRHLLRYTTTAHALCHAVMLSIPLLVPIWLVEFSVTRYELGLLVTLMTGLFGVTALPAGVLSDRVGADRLIALFLFATGTALALTPLVSGVPSLAVVVALVGAGAGLYHSPALSLVSRDADEPSKGFAYHGLGANFGIGLGPLVLTLGLAFTGWRTLLPLLGGVLVLFGLLFVRRGPDDDPGKSEASGSVRTQLGSFVTPLFAAIVFVYVFGGLYYRGTLTFLPDFLNAASSLPALTPFGQTIEPGRWVYSVVLLVGSVGQIAGGNLGERFGPEPVLAAVFVATSAALAALSLASGGGVLAAGIAFGALLFTLPPLQSALVAKYIPTASRGVGFGLVFALNFGVGAFGASLAGWIVTNGTYARLFQVLALLPLGAFAAVLAVRRLRSTTPANGVGGAAVDD